jgi:hypothetical protein
MRLEITPDELQLLMRTVTESAAQWKRIAEESPFPDTAEHARKEWLSLIDLFEKLEIRATKN